jgi:hypothetical protein
MDYNIISSFPYKNMSIHELLIDKFGLFDNYNYVKTDSNKEELVPIDKEQYTNNSVLLTLFLEKIWKYELGIILLIASIHDHNYSYLINNKFNFNPKKPLKTKCCMGHMYANIKSNTLCICSVCDPYGYYLLKDYRVLDSIKKITFYYD